MKTRKLILFTACLSLTIGAACSTTRPAEGPVSPEGQGQEPLTPSSVEGLLVVQHFSLETPFEFTWRKDRRRVTRGALVVLEVNPELVVPRNGLEPILYAGDTPVQRLNHGHESGRVIGIVPGDVDLATVPIWFGAPGLPERATDSTIAAERKRAERAKLRPLATELVRGVESAPVDAKDLAALLRDVAAQLVEQYSPQEKALAASWRLPVVGARGK